MEECPTEVQVQQILRGKANLRSHQLLLMHHKTHESAMFNDTLCFVDSHLRNYWCKTCKFDNTTDCNDNSFIQVLRMAWQLLHQLQQVDNKGHQKVQEENASATDNSQIEKPRPEKT